MFARASSTFVLALPVFAAASILPRNDGCSTGPVQCCASTQSVSNLSLQFYAGTNSDNYLSQVSSATVLLTSLGISVGGLTGLVGCMFLSQDRRQLHD